MQDFFARDCCSLAVEVTLFSFSEGGGLIFLNVP